MALSPLMAAPEDRVARRRRYLMCPPTYFEVTYAINAWMHPGREVDRGLAVGQWERLVATYRSLGHTVEVIEPVPGLPDMVFAANAALALGGRVLTARFRHHQRSGEQVPYRSWFEAAGFTGIGTTRAINEGEGDVLDVGTALLAGYGFRTELAAHEEMARFFGRPVVSLRLIDPRFYHLDTALAVLGAGAVAYWPGAFDAAGRRVLERLFPGALLATEDDAGVLGLNLVSDGRNVVMPVAAEHFAARIARRGYTPVTVDVSELLKGGGGIKCATLELPA